MPALIVIMLSKAISAVIPILQPLSKSFSYLRAILALL
jgi:hypothetical protein